MGSFEIIEHTADVGVRAWGDSPEEAFLQATFGLADIIGAWKPGPGKDVVVEVEARDMAGLLVDWLNEVLYLQDTRDATLNGVNMSEVGETRAVGTVTLGTRVEEVLQGTAVKAITFHGLKMQPEDGGWLAQVYVDV